jgi:hypothetical protein
MRLKLRFAVLWLLVVALPFKALAGVAMVGCGPGHHSGKALQVVASAAEVAGFEAGHHGAGHGQASDLIQVSQDADSPGMTADKGDAPDTSLSGKATHEEGKPSSQFGKMGAGKCGNCAPCCAAAVPASESTVNVGRIASDDGWLDVSDSYVGVVSEVPHQPPRSILG